MISKFLTGTVIVVRQGNMFWDLILQQRALGKEQQFSAIPTTYSHTEMEPIDAKWSYLIIG